MAERPSGQVAFLFTDLEASTRLWERRPQEMPLVYARHDAILRGAIESHDGAVYKVIGDAFQVAFNTASDALQAAVEAQRHMLVEPWPISPAPRVRMALHACVAEPQADGDYRTPGLNRLGRLLSAAIGGQILLSEAVVREARDQTRPDITLLDLGEHRFRDLSPQHVYQLLAPGLPQAVATLPGLAQHRHNLPLQPTSFIGREREIERGLSALVDPQTRVLTLLGSGGIGKTRLALEIASQLTERFADGVWFVPLATVSESELVPQAIASALGVRESVDQSTLEALIAHLETRQTLLLLDNLEQVDAANTITSLIRSCEQLTVLATSRSPIGIAGERELPVPPLDLPPVKGAGSDASHLATTEAMHLFVARAQLVRPSFVLDRENAVAVTEICRRLDGLPLAIELAAARTRLLPPDQLLRRLQTRLPLLVGGPRDLPQRQQTLRGAIDWSYDLLDPAAQTLFARLSVFAGGATLEAVEAVCADEAVAGLAPVDMLDAVEALAKQSLLTIDEESTFPRVRMLETIREYAGERLLQSGERDAVASRHARTYLQLAEQARERLSGAEQADWLDLLAHEHDNFRAALDCLERSADATEHVQLAGALWQFWWRRGHLHEGRDRLRRAIARAQGTNVSPAILARAIDGAGALAEAQGSIEEAVNFHTEALALWQQADDRLGQARSLENLGIIEMHDRGNVAAARTRHEAALALYEAGHDRPGIAAAQRNLGDAALWEERFADAARHYHQALVIARDLGDVRSIAAGLTSLGALAFFGNDFAEAIRRYEESLPLWRQLNDVPGIALVLGNLGEALEHAGDAARARSLYEESLDLVRELGDRQGLAFARSHLAGIARRQGEMQRAATLYVESARTCHEIGDSPRLAECIEGLAGTLLDLGEASQAARLFGFASGIRQITDSPLPAVHLPALEHDLDAARAMIGASQFRLDFDDGASIAADQLESAVEGTIRALPRFASIGMVPAALPVPLVD